MEGMQIYQLGQILIRMMKLRQSHVKWLKAPAGLPKPEAWQHCLPFPSLPRAGNLVLLIYLLNISGLSTPFPLMLRSKSREQFFFFCLFKAASMAYRSSQAWGRNGAAAAGLYHSHINARSELRLQPIPQLMATPDP